MPLMREITPAMSPERAREIAADFDLRALPADFYANPYPVYGVLRATDPVRLMPDGSYFLTRYADLVAVYRDAQDFSSDKKVEFTPKYGPGAPLLEHHTTSLVFNDPPLHTRVRRLIMGALTRRAIAQMEPGLVLLVNGLLEDIAAQGRRRPDRGLSRRPFRWRSSATCSAFRTRTAAPCVPGRWPSWARWSPSSRTSRKPWAIAA
jgi:cytochrome P450